MPVGRLQVAVAADSTLPRDRVVNVLHFEADDVWFGDPTNWGTLCQDLLDGYQAGWMVGAAAREIRVSAYRLSDPIPRAPVAERVENVAAAPASSQPREIALCLSFYGERNLPRQRGRIFLPVFTSSFTASGARPNQTIRDSALGMATRFAALGGVNVDWVIWSPTDQRTVEVKHAYVDDEWDVQRSRGLKPTTRSEATVGP